MIRQSAALIPSASHPHPARYLRAKGTAESGSSSADMNHLQETGGLGVGGRLQDVPPDSAVLHDVRPHARPQSCPELPAHLLLLSRIGK
jgi:hypothetical protein